MNNQKTTASVKTKLVLGSAGKKHSDAITLDIDEEHHPDVIHNLDVVPWPFADNQFSEISAHHVLEHLENISLAMKELHRICRKDGIVCIEVPHYSAWLANSPEHKLRFNYFAFDGYVDGGTTKWVTGKKFKFIKREITFHHAVRRYGLHKIFNRFPLAYERFWTYIFPAEHLKVWLQPIKD